MDNLIPTMLEMKKLKFPSEDIMLDNELFLC